MVINHLPTGMILQVVSLTLQVFRTKDPGCGPPKPFPIRTMGLEAQKIIFLSWLVNQPPPKAGPPPKK